MRNNLFFALFMVLPLSAEETVIHPSPKDPLYLSKKIYPDLKSTLGPAPTAGTPQQAQDEETLRRFQAKRTDADCARAKSEVSVSLNNFFGPQSKTLTEEEVARLSPFFEQVRNDADYFIQQLKADFPRQRPFRYLSDIKPCVPLEITGAYPSGHAVLSKLYAMILSEEFPGRKNAFESRALEIAQDRVLSGMHHPTDVEAGRHLAEFLFAKLMQSKEFKTELDNSLSSLSSPVLAR